MRFEIVSPIHGFEDCKYAVLNKIDDTFMKLELENKNKSSFMLVNPFSLRDYDFEVPQELSKDLNLDDAKEIAIGNIMITKNTIEESVINFVAPVIFNIDTKQMAQVILDTMKYPDFGIVDPIQNYLN